MSARRRSPTGPREERGFTLLEVMIAMAIMVVAFSSILAIQSSSMTSALKSRQIHEVSMLARGAMAQTEVEIAGKKFDEIQAETTGQFEEPFQDYTWTRKVKEIKLPNLAGLSKAASAANASGDAKGSAGGDEDRNSQLMEQMTKVLTNYVSKALREVVITIEWKRGTRSQKYEVAMYWVDLNSEFQINP